MTTYLFPGQGSQYQGMGAGLFDEFPELTEQADSILGYSIKDLCLHNPDQHLHLTQYTQPALYVVNALSYQQQLKQTGRPPDFVAGHSLGEYNALQSSGAVSFADGLKLVKKRGELMGQAPKGAMAAVLGCTEQDIREILHANALTILDIANLNAPTQTILSGLEEDINKAQACFEKHALKFIPLNTSGAFHSRYMNAAQLEFAHYLADFSFAGLTLPVISNIHALPYQQADIAANLAKQITHTVRWSDSIRYLLAQGESEFVELGAGNVLTKLVQAIRQQAPASTAPAANPQPVAPPPLPASQTREATIAAVNGQVQQWNKTYPIGTQVAVPGYEGVLVTKSAAMVLFGHRAAVYMQGYNGYFALDEITPL